MAINFQPKQKSTWRNNYVLRLTQEDFWHIFYKTPAVHSFLYKKIYHTRDNVLFVIPMRTYNRQHHISKGLFICLKKRSKPRIFPKDCLISPLPIIIIQWGIQQLREDVFPFVHNAINHVLYYVYDMLSVVLIPLKTRKI